MTTLTPVRVALRVPQRHGLVSALPSRFGSLASVQSRDGVLRLSVIGLDPQGLLVLYNGFRYPAGPRQGNPQIVVGVGVIGFDPQGLLVVGDGFLELTRLRQSDP